MQPATLPRANFTFGLPDEHNVKLVARPGTKCTLFQARGSERGRPLSTGRTAPALAGAEAYAPWHFLNFLPLPHQHGSLRPICSSSPTRRCSTWIGSS